MPKVKRKLSDASEAMIVLADFADAGADFEVEYEAKEKRVVVGILMTDARKRSGSYAYPTNVSGQGSGASIAIAVERAVREFLAHLDWHLEANYESVEDGLEELCEEYTHFNNLLSTLGSYELLSKKWERAMHRAGRY